MSVEMGGSSREVENNETSKNRGGLIVRHLLMAPLTLARKIAEAAGLVNKKS